MLNEQAIDKLLQPIIQRQEDINLYVLNFLAERIKDIDGLLPSDVYTIQRLIAQGTDVKQLQKELAKMTDNSVSEIRNIIYEVAKDSYKDTLPFFKYRGIKFIPFFENVELQRVVQAIAKQTEEQYTNIAKAQAFMLRDTATNKLKPTSLSNTYQQVLDKAIQASQQGVLSYNQATSPILQELVESGLRTVTYHPESGRTYTQRLDTAVRRNLLDGIRAINQGVQDTVGEQFGADGKEITVHANPAPDHCDCQGHQFTNEEYEKMQNDMDFTDVQGRHYKAFPRAIGTLNCRHFSYSIIVGVTNSNYTDSQLQNIIDTNNQGYVFKLKNGKTKEFTRYECTQKQREYELKIRQLRELLQVAETANNTELISKTKAKIFEKISEYKSFSKACKLKPRMEKTLVKY